MYAVVTFTVLFFVLLNGARNAKCLQASNVTDSLQPIDFEKEFPFLIFRELNMLNQIYKFNDSFYANLFMDEVCLFQSSIRACNWNNSRLIMSAGCCKCDCADDCFYLGTCCEGKPKPDSLSVERGKVASPRHEICLSTTVTGSRPKELPLPSLSYLLVQSCSDNFLDTDISTKCLSGQNSSDAEAWTPVRDINNDIDYANVFCAKCNFISSEDPLKSWPTELSCLNQAAAIKTLIYVTNLSELIERVMRLQGTCTVSWLPPGNTTRACVLDDNVVSRCYSFQNTVLEHLCLTGPRDLYAALGHVFKNVYCFLCSGDASDLSACLADGDGTEFGGIPVYKTVFASLIDFTGRTRSGVSKTDPNGRKCERGLQYFQSIVSTIYGVVLPDT